MLQRLVLLVGWAFSAVTARVNFVNVEYDIEQGKPFTLRYEGCDSGCTITLMTGAASDLRDVEVLTRSATGSSFTVTLNDLDAGTYAFKIANGEGDSGYSAQFKLERDSNAEEPSESETAGSSETSAESTTEAISTSTSTSTASSSSVTSSASSANSKDTASPVSSGTSSTISLASQSTTTSPSPPKRGLSAGAIAGIVIGVLAVVLIVLGALFFWMRRRKQTAARGGSPSNTDPRDSQPQIAELEQPKKIEIVITPATPAEMRGSTPPPPAAELGGQGRLPELPSAEKATEKELEGDVAAVVPELHGEERRTETELEGDAVRTVSELPGEEKALPLELPAGTVRMNNEQEQRQYTIPPPADLPTSSEEPKTTDASTSALPKSPSDAGSTPVTEAISPVSPVSDEANHAMLMEQYAQLEARRQRILELKTIEEEQAALRARLSKMQREDGTK